MRSVYSAGGAVALSGLGFSTLFDDVYATSAGVMNASYFLSDQPDIGITVYYESCASARFINPFRLWKVLNIDYLFDQVITDDKPLDVAKVLANPTRFFVALIDKGSGKGLVVEKSHTTTPWLQVLKAATSMPVFYNRTVEVDGRHCMDGGLAIPFPLEQAIANGCTDILVLLTRPETYRCPAPRRSEQAVFNLICAHGDARLMRTFNDHHEASRRARDLAFGRLKISETTNIATLFTGSAETISRMTANPTRLRQGAIDYARRTLAVFGRENVDLAMPPAEDAAGGRSTTER